MADKEQVEMLLQGPETWNEWRRSNPVKIDLSQTSLVYTNLKGADLSEANINRSDLRGANLNGANLRESDLGDSDFIGAELIDTNLSMAYLRGANLINANLLGANFQMADLSEVNFTKAETGRNIFTRIDLSKSIGLEKVSFRLPSSLGFDTLQLSKGQIPDAFLRGCGLPDWEVESAKLHNPNLSNDEIVKIQYRVFDLRATQALQISPLFISYSHTDSEFVNLLDSWLTEKGVRFWRDIHDAKAGRLETQIDRAIRQNPTVLLVLSKNSLGSDWVEHEVRHARKLEKEFGRDTLCPIALDDSWKLSPWPERVMEQIKEYNILDFSGWQDKSTFDRQFAKLLSGLEIFYKKPAA
ncbi:MAG: toll/interleukin-1 receptor domain-containing protein [Anaerolineaceae bacterium]|nr:MAG: toll/interleukin-1 receptor domain-containing protein [Anaerolineaceae bacterium]